jgi:hypothetical protein
MPTEALALLIPIAAMGIPITAIWTSHLRKMAEIRAQQGATLPPDVRTDLAEMKRQINELRETTTRFDMSFDAAVTRLEERVDHIEERQGANTLPPTPPIVTSVATPEQQPNVLVQGQGRQ